jgi:hypothetical protein
MAYTDAARGCTRPRGVPIIDPDLHVVECADDLGRAPFDLPAKTVHGQIIAVYVILYAITRFLIGDSCDASRGSLFAVG